MKTIILNNNDLTSISPADPTDVYEKEFEPIVLKVLSKLFSRCHVFPFKPLVKYENVNWKPDVAIVDRDMEFWFILEIETIDHSLQKHVLPQVIAFRDGEFGLDAAKIISESTGVSVEEAKTLIKYVPKSVGVISNYFDHGWQSTLESEDIQYLSITIFDKVIDWKAAIVEGILAPSVRSVGFGSVIASQRVIRIARHKIFIEQTYQLIESTGVSSWDCFFYDGAAWLRKKRGIFSLPDKEIVQLILQDDGTILIKSLF